MLQKITRVTVTVIVAALMMATSFLFGHIAWILIPGTCKFVLGLGAIAGSMIMANGSGQMIATLIKRKKSS